MADGRGTVLRAAAAYVGAVAGAGLLSGRESAQFFLPFGLSGLWGAGASVVLFALAGGVVLDYSRRINAASHRDVLLSLVGPWASRVLDCIISVFLFLAVAVMMAGAGALLSGTYGFSLRVGTLVLALVSAAILTSGTLGFLRINAGMVIALLTIVAVVIWKAGWQAPHFSVATNVAWGFTPRYWLLAAIIYAAYNIGLSLSLLTALGGTLHSAKESWAAGALGGAALGGTILLVTRALAADSISALTTPVPMLIVVERAGRGAHPAFVVGMMLALATTAVGSAFALARRMSGGRAQVERWIGISVVALSLPVSTYGFMELVRVVYPLFGYLVCAVVLWVLLPKPPLGLVRAEGPLARRVEFHRNRCR